MQYYYADTSELIKGRFLWLCLWASDEDKLEKSLRFGTTDKEIRDYLLRNSRVHEHLAGNTREKLLDAIDYCARLRNANGNSGYARIYVFDKPQRIWREVL